VPQCDDDGFYKPVQCDANSGQCWCADRNGRRLNGTTTNGNLDCCKLHHPSTTVFVNSTSGSLVHGSSERDDH
jgi:hypothetical protein